MSEQHKLRELDCTNLAVDWKNWKRDFMVYMIANDKIGKNEATKIAVFLWQVGTKGANIYNTLFPNDGSQNSLLGTQMKTEQVAADASTGAAAYTKETVDTQRTLQEVLDKFDAHCLPQKNAAMESFKFNNMVQKERQPFNDFLTELRTQIERCDFDCKCGVSYEDRMLRDRIITGVYDKKLQLKLLDGKDEALNKVIETCKSFEAANVNKGILDSNKQVVASITSPDDMEPDAINAIKRPICYSCGGDWRPDHKSKCPARNSTCSCGKKGHYFKMCRNKGKSAATKTEPKSKGKQQVSKIDWPAADSGILENKSHDRAHLFSNNCMYRINSIGKKAWTKAYQLGSDSYSILLFKIDTGADVNCIPLKIVKKMKIKMSNEQNDFPVVDYSNNKIKIFGLVELKLVDLKTKKENVANFVVVEDAFEPILGRETCNEFGLIKRLDVDSLSAPELKEQFVSKHKEVFSGLGKFPERVSIQLKDDAKPVVHYKKRFPETVIKKLKPKLDQMVIDGVISPVSHPTDWVNNLQLREKENGELRLCLDPKPLNACIKREHFLIPTLDNFISELSNKKVFSTLDCSSGFWQMELDDQSSELTTFMTPFGRYKFNRLPFGLNCAPEMFQKQMVRIFGDIPGVLIYFDDVLITAVNEEEHDKTLSIVMKRARQFNVKFNPNKIQYRQSKVKFMGHFLSDGSIEPSEKYKDAILQMEKPTDKQGVMRLLGMFKYLSKFIPNLSKITAEMRRLSGKDVPFEWNQKHDDELTNLLKIITSKTVLAVYDPEKPVIIQTDASKDGLGSVLIQEGRPVGFVSRTLSKSEQKWAQIEKELLAIVFACQRFHYYLYGREFLVESDHKPLEALMKRDIDDVTPRLQRMFMALLKYSKADVMYKPGKSMLVADCLSRAQLPEVSEMEGLSCVIHALTKKACISEENYKYYLSTLQRDEKYKQICQYVEHGWPNYHLLCEVAQKFHKLKSELHFENGLLFVNHRLVIPTAMQSKIAKWLHEPHLGIEKTLARARMLYYWPGMNNQIKELVASCSVCEKFKRNNQKEPLVQEENAKYPFQSVSMDLFEYAGRDYIAMFDAYSNYLCAAGLTSKTSRHIIDVITPIFDKIGYPSRVRSDNVPFNSADL